MEERRGVGDQGHRRYGGTRTEDRPGRYDALGVDHPLPRHVDVVETGIGVLGEVLQTDANLAGALGCCLIIG